MTDTHLDDEAISAVLDGEATPEEAAHAERCTECTLRLTELRDAALLVGAPVPPLDATRRAEAIAAALGSQPDTVAPIRRRLPPAWLGVAAAMIVAVAAVALLSRGGADSEEKQTAAGAGADSTSAATSATPAPELQADTFASAAPAGPIDGGDLGDLAAVDVDQTVRDAVDRQQTTAAAPAPSASGGAAGARTASPPCADQVEAAGMLVYFASGELDGTAVTVLVYDDGAARTLDVVATDGCVIRDQRQLSRT